MFWRTERKKLMVAFLVVGLLYTVCMLIGKHSVDNANADGWNAGHPSQFGPILFTWGLGALAVLTLWVLTITLNYLRKNACEQCGTVTRHGAWVQPVAGGEKVFLCSADFEGYQRQQRMAAAEALGRSEEQYTCPVCRTGAMAKVPTDVGIEAFPINKCNNCGAVLATGERHQKVLAYREHMGYQQGLAKARLDDADDFTSALIAGAVAGSVSASISSSFNAPSC